MRPRRLLTLAAALGLLSGGSSAFAQIYTRVNENGVLEATNVPGEASFRLTYPGKGTLIHSRGFSGVYNGQYDGYIRDAANAFGVGFDLVRAVIQAESAFDQWAVSSKGAQGLMQLMPATARRFGVGNPFDARQNIFGGTQYLRFLLDLFKGNVAHALAAYNAGENAVVRYHGVPPYKETQGYVRKVQSLLGGVSRVVSFAPGHPRLLPRPAVRRSRPRPAKPPIYYRWEDANGTTHVAQSPPAEGIAYSMIRALD